MILPRVCVRSLPFSPSFGCRSFTARAAMECNIALSSVHLGHSKIWTYQISKRVSYGIGFPVCCEMVKMADRVVANPAALEEKKTAIMNDGLAKFQVIADFDATLTKYWINGRRGQSSHGLLQQGNSAYDIKRQELFDYYHPLEFSPTIPVEEKTKLMEEWWEKTHALLVEGGLTFDDIKRSVSDAVIEFRDGVVELFELLERKDVPILIFSAGLADIIEEVLSQKLKRSFKNIKIVSNRMIFDGNGKLMAFRGKTIHVLNKNEHALDMAAPLHSELGGSYVVENDSSSIIKRTNVLLLGDHIGDLGMSDGLRYDNRISVAFLNDNVEKSIDGYRQAFDIVLLNDSSMWPVVDLVAELSSPPMPAGS